MVRLGQDGKAQARLAAEHRHWSQILECRASALDAALEIEGMAGLGWQGGFFVTLGLAHAAEACSVLKAKGVYTVPLPEGLRLGLCGMRVEDAPRLAAALRGLVGPR
jgi:hypothetical protein